MNRKIIIALGLALVLLLLAGCTAKVSPEVTKNKLTIYKSSSCGCCGIYSKYAETQGFNVEIKTMSDVSSIKEKYNVPANLQSCHTSVIGDYYIEGHVPIAAIEKLMTEKPDIAGIAMPGMPSGSPGMPGKKSGEWVISAVGKDGSISEFMRI